MIEYENLQKVNSPFMDEFMMVFKEVLESGRFILGDKVREFEEDFAKYHNIDFCCGVASGLDALTLSLNALEMPQGSDILVPSNTYIATILSIIHAKHNPVFVEPDILTYNIDPDKIEDSITPETRAIMIVHLYGKPCDMDAITDICRRKNLYLIEDCAQAHGAEYKGRKAGTFGDLAAFSFYPTKNLGCLGDGGAVLTNNEDFDKRVRMLRNYGSEKKYYNERIGINSRLDEIQAAFLSVKLKKLDQINKHKRGLANLYFKGIDSRFVLPEINKDTYDVYHIFNIRHKNRDNLKKYLSSKNIGTDIHYPLAPHLQNALKFLGRNKYPVSEEIHSTTLSLPVSFCHTETDILQVIGAVNSFND